MSRLIFILACSYLLGSIPFGYLLVRVVHGEDVRRSGSGNIGATNVARKSPALGILTLLMDALKGSASVLIGIVASPSLAAATPRVSWAAVLPGSQPSVVLWASWAALFAVLGHLFPVWLKFRGGKGVATGLGAFAMIAPKAVLVSAAIFIVLVIALRYVSLGSIVAVAAFPNVTLVLHEYGNVAAALVLMALASVLIVVKHHANIARLLSGRENRLGSRHT